MEKQLRNYTEAAVEAYLERWFVDADCCHCDVCRMDVMAMMLNNLKPKYVVTEKGELFAQLDQFDYQTRIDFMTVMSQAAEMIKKNPRHPKE